MIRILDRFLGAAEARAPKLYPLFFLVSRTGLRLGEALALKWEDLDLSRHHTSPRRPHSSG